MKKIGIIIAIVVIAIIVILKSMGFSFNRVIDWEESFNEKSTKPYGVSVFYKELPKLFKDKKFRTIYYTPSTYLYANSKEGYGEHAASGNFVIIGNSDYLDNYDINIVHINYLNSCYDLETCVRCSDILYNSL